MIQIEIHSCINSDCNILNTITETKLEVENIDDFSCFVACSEWSKGRNQQNTDYFFVSCILCNRKNCNHYGNEKTYLIDTLEMLIDENFSVESAYYLSLDVQLIMLPS